MPNYLLAYHGGGMPETDEARAQVMAAWGKWFGELGSSLIDGGNPVGRARTVNGGGTVADGGGANPLTGYSLIKADSLDAAVALARGCPIVQDSAHPGSIEVCETFDAM